MVVVCHVALWVGDADMRCGSGVNGRPPKAACKSA
jgi:hypothetical protein